MTTLPTRVSAAEAAAAAPWKNIDLKPLDHGIERTWSTLD
jgi:hypothetical protein